jgi:hypothetical protein
MVIGYSTFVNARIAAMRFQGIFEFGPRRDIRIVIPIILGDFSLKVFTSLARLRDRACSAIRS